MLPTISMKGNRTKRDRRSFQVQINKFERERERDQGHLIAGGVIPAKEFTVDHCRAKIEKVQKVALVLEFHPPILSWAGKDFEVLTIFEN